MASGLRRQRTGWRKTVVRAGVIFLSTVALTLAIALLITGLRR